MQTLPLSHLQDRKMVAFVVVFVTLESLETHESVKLCSSGILLVDIHIFHKHPPQSLADISRMKEQHLDFAILHAHETDGGLSVLQHPQGFYMPQCFFGLRSQAYNVLFRQKMMGGTHASQTSNNFPTHSGLRCPFPNATMSIVMPRFLFL